MIYNLRISKDLDKFLNKHRDIAPKIIECLDKISQNPFDNELDIRPLVGYKNHYRLRISKYRILYEILKDEILIYAYDADSRGDIYKGQR